MLKDPNKRCCIICHTYYIKAISGFTKYCSIKCQVVGKKIAQRKKYLRRHPVQEKTCLYCTKVFIRQSGPYKYCSVACSKEAEKIRDAICKKKYIAEHRDEINEYNRIMSRKYYHADPSKHKESQRRWRKKNIEHYREYHKTYQRNLRKQLREEKISC